MRLILLETKAFEGYSMLHEPEDVTVLSGMLDQSSLHGILMRVRDLGLKIISIKPVETTRQS
jgi:hypothetical protein